jgi:hypothetical protein
VPKAKYQVPEPTATALAELGLAFYGPGSGQEAAVRALPGQAIAGSLATRALAAAIHHYFGYSLPLVERLPSLPSCREAPAPQ